METRLIRLYSIGFSLLLADQLVLALALRLAPEYAHFQHVAWYSNTSLVIGFFVAAFILERLTYVVSPVALVFLGAGGISNAITLISRGAVVDYIPAGPFWTNLADIYIICGIVLAVVLLFAKQKRP